MAEIVLRVRLIGGDHVDVAYGDRDATADEVAERAISTLAEDGGALRCEHGDRLMVLYSRGVATIEIAPRGAVL
jgi:predicted RNA-binding protein with PIN domain